MPDEIEVETKDLQENIERLNDERAERQNAEKQAGWLRFIGLSTAILAVFAAIAALQSSNLVNEALIHQIQASDTWAEYQADRQKDHVYTIALNGLLDAATTKRATARVAEYRAKIAGESSKETALSDSAKGLERETEDEMRKHHAFEYSVALLQVAIAVGAVSALTRVKPIWYLSLLIGAIGSAFCVVGFIH